MNKPDPDRKIKDLEKEISRLKKLAHYDELTGLYNRRGFINAISDFIKALESEFSGFGKERKLKIGNLSIVFADLNKFKQINDRFGHQCGDELLIAFGKLLFKNVRGVDAVGRWSGDEFVIALIGADKQDAEAVVKKISNDLIGRAFDVCGVEKNPVSASFGVASVYDETRKPRLVFDLKKLIAEADKEMYKEKSKGSAKGGPAFGGKRQKSK
ncbi:MAG: GGDEF domain-containing protein [Patescibacteria group bacterium]